MDRIGAPGEGHGAARRGQRAGLQTRLVQPGWSARPG